MCAGDECDTNTRHSASGFGAKKCSKNLTVTAMANVGTKATVYQFRSKPSRRRTNCVLPINGTEATSVQFVSIGTMPFKICDRYVTVPSTTPSLSCSIQNFTLSLPRRQLQTFFHTRRPLSTSFMSRKLATTVTNSVGKLSIQMVYVGS